MTEQIVLTDREREVVALGAAVGAGCRPCTQYHVKAALAAGLTGEEIGRTLGEAQTVRHQGGTVVANVGRRALGIGEEPLARDGMPSDRDGALAYLGAAFGCNAGSLLAAGLEHVQDSGLSPEEARSAIEIAGFVKERAADFLRRDVDRALPAADTGEKAATQGCCGPEAVGSAAGAITSCGS